MAACLSASSVTTAPDPTTDSGPLEVSIDMDAIDMEAFKDPANWNLSNDTIAPLSGTCDQGECPDYNEPFELVYQFVAVPVAGDPPLTILEGSSAIRVNDYNQYLRKKVDSTSLFILPVAATTSPLVFALKVFVSTSTTAEPIVISTT